MTKLLNPTSLNATSLNPTSLTNRAELPRRLELRRRLAAIAPLALGTLVLINSGWDRSALAQDACCFQPAYRLQYETVMEPRQETSYRRIWETVPETREVTETKFVLKTRTEDREYTVARPVVETSYRDEQYTVMKAVLETSTRPVQRTQTTMVTETSERVEQYTTMRPVVETRYQQQQYQVQRPVVETSYQTQAYTTLRPVTTYQNQVVDTGGYVAQQMVTPGTVGYGLQWVPRAYQTTGPLGILAVNRGGLFWTPSVTPPTVQTQMAYRPNYVNQQVAQTQYVPETVQQQVPVQVSRMQTEVVTQNVPVQVTTMQPTVETRRVPVTVQRPVTETVTENVPVQQYKYIPEVKTRRIPIQTTKMTYETLKQPVEVQYYEPETVTRQVTVQRQVEKLVPETRTVMVPRQVIQRVAPNYYDPFGAAISGGYSTFMPVVEYSTPAVVVPEGVSESSQKPKTELQGVESKPVPETDDPDSPSDKGADGNDESGAGDLPAANDDDKIDVPALGGPENTPANFRSSPFNRNDRSA